MTERGTRTVEQSSGSDDGGENNTDHGGPVDSGASVDQLAERLREAENVDQDLATIVAENWQKVLGLLVCMLLAIWVVEEYKSAKQKKLGEASDKFVLIQESYKSAAEDNATVIQQNVKALNAEAEAPFYGKTAPLYDAKLLFEKGEFEAAKNVLASFDIEPIIDGKFVANEAKLSSAQISNELAVLLLSRILISEDSLDQARKYLIGLSKAGTVTSVEALIILYRIAETTEQKDAALAAVREVRTAKPQYGEALEREFRTLGVSLDTAAQ